MSFKLLPDDTVRDILDVVLVSPYNFVSLCNIALCSKRFNDLATPLIYKNIELDGWDGEITLLRTLLRNPRLGEFCKSLTSYRDDFEPATPFSFNPDELASCKDRIEKFCDTPEEVDQWLVDLQNTEWEASAGLLLSYMPKVEKISINQYQESSLNSIDRVLGHAAMLQSEGNDSPLALSRLTCLHGSFHTHTKLNMLMPFLRLKSLQKVELDQTIGDMDLRVETPSLILESLVLSTVIDGGWSRLEGFLSSFQNLKSFRLLEDDGERDPYYESDPLVLDDAISGLKHCLEELEIDHQLRAPEDPPWISSLADFSKLTGVSMNAYVLFKPGHEPNPGSIDVLPASLETLEMVTYDQYALDQLLRMMQRKQEVMPKLVHIQLKRRVVDSGDEVQLARFEDTVRDLKRICDDAATSLEFFEEETAQAVNNRSTIWKRIE